MKRLTPNQKLSKEIDALNGQIKTLKAQNEALTETLARKRVNETIADSKEVVRFFRDIKPHKNYRREEMIEGVLEVIEKGLRAEDSLTIDIEYPAPIVIKGERGLPAGMGIYNHHTLAFTLTVFDR